MTREKEASGREPLTLSVPPGTRERLVDLAERHDFRWGVNPNPSALVVAIAEGRLNIGFSLRPPQVDALLRAVRELSAAGLRHDARLLLDLASSYGRLDDRQRRQAIEDLDRHAPLEWRARIEELIAERRPFKVLYRGTRAKHLQDLTVRFARIRFWKRHHYLEAWVAEDKLQGTYREPDEALAHNRLLRIDRIKLVEALPGEFGKELGSVRCEFLLSGDLPMFYEQREDDVRAEPGPEKKTLVVEREVCFADPFVQEMLSYGENVTVRSPAAIRQIVAERLTKASRNYPAG